MTLFLLYQRFLLNKFRRCFHLQQTFQKPLSTRQNGFIEIENVGLQINIMKCEFHVQKTRILKIYVFTERIRMASEKMKTVFDRPKPVKLKELQPFFNSCSFYRRFIKIFSKKRRFPLG